jgi:hypothetical protein
MRSRAKRARFPAALALALGLAAGCGSVKTSSTPRTGTEQLLLTNAWDTALAKVDFRPLAGVPVFLDTSNLKAVDEGWAIASIRRAMLTQGVLLREKKEQAQWIVEASIGAFGTDSYDLMVGVPQVWVPPTVTGVPTGTVPEMPLMKKSNQQGVAKLMLFAYDRGSGHLVWSSGTMLATANAKDVFVAGVGPIQSGTIRGGTDFIGVRIPLTSEASQADSGSRRRRRRRAADPAATTTPPPALAPSNTDLESFAP